MAQSLECWAQQNLSPATRQNPAPPTRQNPAPPTRQNPAPPTRQNPGPPTRQFLIEFLIVLDSEFDESNSDEEETVAIGEQSTGEEPNQNSPNRESEESNLNDEEPVAIGEQSTGVEKIEGLPEGLMLQSDVMVPWPVSGKNKVHAVVTAISREYIMVQFSNGKLFSYRRYLWKRLKACHAMLMCDK